MPELQRSMVDAGVTAYGVTSFAIDADVDVADLEGGLDRGARLGAQYASVRIVKPYDDRVIEPFGRFAEMAARYGITASIEFTGFRTPEILPRTLHIIEQAGAGTLTIDPLHIVRTGVAIADMQRAGASRLGYVQLCDGPLDATESEYWHEMGAERLPLGEGAFPLDAIFALAPAGRAVSLEIPGESQRAQGVPAQARAERAVIAARRFLARVEPD